jgi:NAD+ synthase
MNFPDGLVITDLEKTRKSISNFIKDYVEKSQQNGIILGLSGGIDSALVVSLAVDALGPERVQVMLMPVEKEKDERNIADAKSLIQQLGITYDLFELRNAINAFKPLNLNRIALGNVAARLRMITLYAKANNNSLLVAGTGNRTEILTGYFTKYGDGACDLLPIANLYKINVRGLAKHMNVPDPIINKAPSAGLWENQTDEGEMGLTYNELDTILFLRFDQGYSSEQIIDWGIEKSRVERAYVLVAKSQHKRDPIPTPNKL